MMRAKTTIVLAAGLALYAAQAFPATYEAIGGMPIEERLSISTSASADRSDTGFERHATRGADDIVVNYRLPYASLGALYGSVSSPGELDLGVPASAMSRFAGLDGTDSLAMRHWNDPDKLNASVFTFGYAWRDVRVEGSAFSAVPDESPRPDRAGALRIDARSARLAFRPSPRWNLQLSRGTASGLDQLVPGAEVRRTTLSATYNLAFREGDLQTTVAWGRSARRYRESTMGYLFESTLRFAGTHAVFGRLERVGSDDLLRENESMQRQMFKMNKVTIGYFHEVRATESLRFDVGTFVSRHLVPSEMAPSYGASPTSYILFVRLKLR